MSFVIERAKFGDSEKFFDLWVPYLEEMKGIGAGQSPVEFYRTLFNEYTAGRTHGVALFAVESTLDVVVGVSLWGIVVGELAGQPAGESAFGWGVYTVPNYRKQGISTALREHSIIALADMGVEKATGVVALNNHAGIESSRANGFVPTEVIGVMDLAEQAARIKNGTPHPLFKHEGHCPMCERD